MKIIETRFQDLYVLEFEPIHDERGYFVRKFCINEMSSILKSRQILQVNESGNLYGGTTRGLHFQVAPHAETKIVSCTKGAVFDVVVDMRSDSDTFLEYFSIELRESGFKALYIPEGFAHGYQVLKAASRILYFTTALYSKEHEHTLRFDDPKVNINWPRPISHISVKDASAPYLVEGFTGISQFTNEK